MTLLRDLRYALRTLRRQPGVSLVILLTLAVGIGAVTALFTFLLEEHWTKINAPDVERLFFVRTGTDDNPSGNSSYRSALRYREALEGLGEVSPWDGFAAALTPPKGVPEHSIFGIGLGVSPEHFGIFGVHEGTGRRAFPLGRGFRADAFEGGGARVVVVDYTYWRRHLAADPDIVGKTMQIRSVPYTVVGVAPRGFENAGRSRQVYVPRPRLDELRDSPQVRTTTTLFRMDAGAPVEATRAEALARLAVVGRRLDAEHPLDKPRRFHLENVEAGVAPLDPTDLMLAGAVSLLLLLACANVANLTLARAAGRQREIAVLAAMGAGRWRVARRLLTESVLLAVGGGVLGLGVNRVITGLMSPFYSAMPVGWTYLSEGNEWRQIDGRVLAFTAGVSLLTGCLFGLAPVLHAARTDLVSALKAAGADPGPGRRLGARHLLVVAQVALSTVLVLTTALLSRSIGELRKIDLGFDTEHRVILALTTSPRSDDPARRKDVRRRLYETARQELLRVPGVVAATFAEGGPRYTTRVDLVGRGDESLTVGTLTVGPDFFETYALKPRSGRAFDPRDRAGAVGAAIVNQTFVDRFFEDEMALGRELVLPDLHTDVPENRFTVVGVVPDFGYVLPGKARLPMICLPFDQYFYGRALLRTMVRVEGPPAAMIGRLRQAADGAHPDVAVVDAGTYERQRNADLWAERLNAAVVTLFSAFGLGLACLGVYSAMSCSVSHRRHEIGIRMAVGATGRDVVRLVLGETAWLVTGGVVLGVAAALGAGQLLKSLLYGVAPYDPVTFLTVPLVLIAVAVAAAARPASRAGRVDPAVALHDE